MPIATDIYTPEWETCFEKVNFPNSIKGTYFIEGDLDGKHISLSDKVENFEMFLGGNAPPQYFDTLRTTRDTTIWGTPTVSFGNNSLGFNINLNMPSFYIDRKDIHLKKTLTEQYEKHTLSHLNVGDLPILSTDVNKFALTVHNTCYTNERPYGRGFMATSAWGEQKNSYIRLKSIKKRDAISVYQSIYDVPLTDYELEFEFAVTLYKDPNGRHIWHTLSNGKMRAVLSFFNY